MALEVGVLYAKLTLQDGQFTSGMTRAEGKMSALAAKMRAFNPQLNLRDEKFTSGMTRATGGMERLRNVVKIAGKEVKEFEEGFQERMERLNEIGHVAALGLVAGFGAMAYAGIKANSDTEQFLATMTRLTGSTAEAKRQLQELKAFAANTPFEMEDLKQGELVMRAVGLDTEKWRQTIGDTAAAWKSAGKTYMDVVQAIADAQTGELERLKEFGITKQQIIDHGNEIMRGHQLINNKQQITDLKAFNEVLLDLLKKRYGGMMQVQSKTFAGMMSNIKDFSTYVLEQMSKPLFKRAEEGAQSLMNTLQRLQTNGTVDVWAEKISDKMDQLSNTFAHVDWGAAGTALKFTAAAGAALYFGNMIVKLGSWLRLLAVESGPLGWALLGVGMLAGAMATAKDRTEELSVAQTKIAGKTLLQAQANEKLISEYEALRNKTNLTAAGMLRYMEIQDEIARTKSPEKLKQLRQQLDLIQQGSGLSNQELKRMIDLDQKLQSILPGVDKVMDAHGHSVARTAEQYRQLNREMAIKAEADLQAQRALAMRTKDSELQKELDALRRKAAAEQKLAELTKKQADTLQQISQLQEHIDKEAAKGIDNAMEHQKLATLMGQAEAYRRQIEEQKQALNTANADLKLANSRLNKLIQVDRQLESIYLKTVGIDNADGKGYQILVNKIKQLDQAIQKKQQEMKASAKNREVLEQELKKLEDQRAQYQRVLDKVNSIHSELVKTQSQIQHNISITSAWNSELGKDIYKNVTVAIRQTVETVNPGALISVHNLEHNIMPKFKRHSGGTIPKMLRVPGFGEVNALLKGGETILTERHTNDLINMLERGGKQDRGGDVFNIKVETPAQEWVGRDVVRHVSRARRRMLI